MENKEGIVKFKLDFSKDKLKDFDIAEFNYYRSLCIERGWIGQDDSRYEGLGFGNLSIKSGYGKEFVISGTQTGDKAKLAIDDFALVYDFEIKNNLVRAKGFSQPSSESMTHAVLYECSKAIKAVIHIHSPKIWSQTLSLSLSFTESDIPYGTVAMARAVQNLLQAQNPETEGVFSMLGHEDGIIAFAPSLSRAFTILENITKKIG